MCKILIIQTAFVGDVILITPLLRAIRQELPGCQVTLMVTPATSNLVEKNPFIKHLWIFDKHDREKGLISFKNWVNKIRKEDFEIGLLPHRSYRSALLLKLAKIPIRIGFDRSHARWTYTHLVDYNYLRHEIIRNLDLLRHFGVVNPGMIRPEIFRDEIDVSVIDEELAGRKLTTNRPLIALAPGSIWFTKRWPEEHYVSLANLFLNKNYAVCLIGGIKDLDLAESIQRKASAPVFNFVNRFTLRQSAELLQRCSLLVCNDSAPTHIASAVNTPTITIYGSTVPGFGFAPVAVKNRIMEKKLACRPCTDHGRKKCPIKTLACLRDISPDEVFQTALKLMKED